MDWATRATTVPVYTTQGSGTATAMVRATRATRVREIRTTPGTVRFSQILMVMGSGIRMATTVCIRQTPPSRIPMAMESATPVTVARARMTTSTWTWMRCRTIVTTVRD